MATADTESAETIKEKRGWLESFLTLLKPQVLPMWFLGFSAGLPLLLLFSTLSAWLREGNISLGSIGFISYVLLTYSIKFTWSPLVDRLPIPILTALLGRRRSWMLLAQICIAAGLLGMASTDPATSLSQMILFGVFVAVSSATQDIAIDAYRIEAAAQDLQGAMSAAYIYGYRIGMLVAGGGALVVADAAGWFWAYASMAALMAVGVLTVLLVKEPPRQEDARTREALEKVVSQVAQGPVARGVTWLIDAFVSPFLDFFRRNGLFMAVVILAFVGLYRFSDIVMGVMAIPFYIDMGYTKTDIGAITKGAGLFLTLLGVGLGGVMVARWGVMRPLLIGAVLVALTNLVFTYMAVVTELFPIDAALSETLFQDAGIGGWIALSERVEATPGPSLAVLTGAICMDNISAGIATTAFIAYLSGLTNRAYTATQYALFSSFMTLPGKLTAGFSGVVVEQVGYASFFTYAAMLGIPAILLVLFLMTRRDLRAPPKPEAATAAAE